MPSRAIVPSRAVASVAPSPVPCPRAVPWRRASRRGGHPCRSRARGVGTRAPHSTHAHARPRTAYGLCARAAGYERPGGNRSARRVHGQELLDGVRHRMAGGQSDATLKRTNKLLFTILTQTQRIIGWRYLHVPQGLLCIVVSECGGPEYPSGMGGRYLLPRPRPTEVSHPTHSRVEF